MIPTVAPWLDRPLYPTKFQPFSSILIGKNSNLFILQHGGSYGIGKFSHFEDHEKEISDKYLVWGWGKPNSGFKNIPVHIINERFHGKWSNKGGIAIIMNQINFFDKLKSDFNEEALINTGLFYLDEKKKIYVERFKGRLIFPINNISGQPIALGGRIIEKSNYMAKYINSPETAFFKKGSNLYKIHKQIK